MAQEINSVNPSTRYKQDGYLSQIEVMTPTQMSVYREAFDRLEAELGEQASSVGVMGKHKEIEWIWELASHPKVIEAAKWALGPDLLMLGTHFFCKYPEAEHGSHFVAWHQDITYWNLEPIEKNRVVTVWLAVDNADIENGCMRVIPASHHDGLLPHGKSEEGGNLLSINQAIHSSHLNIDRAVDIELTGGCASIHDGLLVHGSNPNQSTRRRCGLTIRFTTPQVRHASDDRAEPQWAPILVAGQDTYQHFDLYPTPVFT